MKLPFFDIDERLALLDDKAMQLVKDKFAQIDEISAYNQQKMLSAFIKNKVSESHFVGSTGYGYGDRGREVLDSVMADALGAQSCIIRHNFLCGTHALTVALFGLLRPGDTMLAATGVPYDTLVGVIGINGEKNGSLNDFNINYDEVPLLDEKPDIDEILRRVKSKHYKLVHIQRSRGYSLRPSLSVDEIGNIANKIKQIDPECIIFVDNCYGEFVEKYEPCSVGTDIIVGSLIKNAGGGIAPTGGYIAGREDLVEQCANRLTFPGAAGEVGATLGLNRELFMGVYNAPNVTGEALKTAVYASALLELLGYEVTPRYDEKRNDIIQCVKLGTREKLIAFCKGMQMGAPVDAFVAPEPCEMPGYDSEIIMAAGAFTMGSSIELSADAPLREPFAVWMQGGTIFNASRVGVLLAINSIL